MTKGENAKKDQASKGRRFVKKALRTEAVERMKELYETREKQILNALVESERALESARGANRRALVFGIFVGVSLSTLTAIAGVLYGIV